MPWLNNPAASKQAQTFQPLADWCDCGKFPVENVFRRWTVRAAGDFFPGSKGFVRDVHVMCTFDHGYFTSTCIGTQCPSFFTEVFLVFGLLGGHQGIVAKAVRVTVLLNPRNMCKCCDDECS